MPKITFVSSAPGSVQWWGNFLWLGPRKLYNLLDLLIWGFVEVQFLHPCTAGEKFSLHANARQCSLSTVSLSVWNACFVVPDATHNPSRSWSTEWRAFFGGSLVSCEVYTIELYRTLPLWHHTCDGYWRCQYVSEVSFGVHGFLSQPLFTV